MPARALGSRLAASWAVAWVGACLCLSAPALAQISNGGNTPAPVIGPDAASDKRCMQCHGQAHIAELSPQERRSMVGTRLDSEDPAAVPPTEIAPLTGEEPATRPSLLVKPEAVRESVHAELHCVECHTDARLLPHPAKLNTATCATSCHENAAKDYALGSHSEALLAKNPLAPTCASCHGSHEILKVSDRKSAQNKLNSLHLCGDCHEKHAPVGDPSDPKARVLGYLGSTHARAVTKAGLPMAATCADCHGAHGVLPAKEPTSSVNRTNVPSTCGKCHVGVLEQYELSVHGMQQLEGNDKAAVCSDCHTAHDITHASSPDFMLDVIGECGRCHDSPDAEGDRIGTYYQTYAESYHGQVTQLGDKRAARCSDCHGAHDIRSLDDPRSRVAKGNLISTCAECHEGANSQFVKFDPHANYRDAKNYPILHGVWLYFMIMMSSVFTFFGVHTILWFFRAKRERARMSSHAHHHHAATAIRRFSAMDRVNHALVALTFFGLTATGIPLVFNDDAWAKWVVDVLGGVKAAGQWHRFFAILLIINFTMHFAVLGYRFFTRKCSAREWLFGPASLMPRFKDAKDMLGMFRWFFAGGKMPRLDRWTYWEKFDYWAEVGGSMIIGGSGLLLWFPVIASYLIPGWAFNIAMIVHGYEALLAIGFIFTIHFFNAHLRPGTFPVDPVIFTGSMPEEELKETRPEEYARLVASNSLDSLRVPAADPKRRPAILVTAIVSVGFGLLLLAFILIGGLL